MKTPKSRIIKFYRRIDFKEYVGSIIIPLNPFNFAIRSSKILKDILLECLSTPKKIVKKKEKEMIDSLSSNPKNIEIERNFCIIFNGIDSVEISPFHTVSTDSEDENLNIENYLKDYKDKIKHSDIKGELTQLVYEYKISFKTDDA